MSFTIRPVGDTRKTVTCNGCGATSDPTPASDRFNDVRDTWRRAHICNPHGRPLNPDTAVQS